MEITEIRIIKKEDQSKKLRAFVNVTFDGCFVVRDMKVVEGSKGLFVAMPSRRLKTSCSKCGYKCQVGSRYCSHCGAELPPSKGFKDEKDSGHKDIAHPITLEFREKLQKTILEAYGQQDSQVSEETPRPISDNPEGRPSMNLSNEDYQ